MKEARQRAAVVRNQNMNLVLARDKVHADQRKSEKEMNNDRVMASKELEEIKKQDRNNKATQLKKKKQFNDELQAMIKEKKMLEDRNRYGVSEDKLREMSGQIGEIQKLILQETSPSKHSSVGKGIVNDFSGN